MCTVIIGSVVDETLWFVGSLKIFIESEMTEIYLIKGVGISY